jgi:hypothetical protein
MIVQFFDYGSGLSKGPLDYLLGKDRAREHAKIISGHEQETAELIDSSPFAKKYTSGCLSFYEDDLSEEAKKEIMANFEKCLFPGLDQGQYRVLWIEHRDKVNEATGEKRLELNFLIPNVEVHTGRRLQPFYHKADMSRVDLFKKVTNFEHSLHDPDDPLFRQAVTTKKSLPKKIEDIKAVIDIEAQKAIEAGLITDRASMTKWLIDLGLEVENEKKKSISIKNPHATSENSRNIRLTGAIYEQDFRITAESAGLTRAASERFRREARERYEADLRRYREHLEQKGAELGAKYLRHDEYLGESTEQSYSRDHAADTGQRQDCEKSAGHDFASSPGRPEGGTGDPASELAAIERLEPRNSPSSQIKENPYYIDYSLDFDSLYSSYFQHCNERNQLREIHANSGQKSSNSSHRQIYSIENAGVGRFIHSDLQHQQESQIEQKDGYASTVINDYRAATAAAQRATEAARASLAAVAGAAESLESASASYRRARSIHSDLESETQRGWADSETVSADRAAAIRADHLRAFFKGLTAAVSKRFKSAFDEVASVFGLAGADKSLSARASAEADASRAREADPSFSAEAGSETRLSTTVSRTIRGFNTGSIFKALDELDRRRELQLEQQRRNEMDSGYDGPSF